MTITTKNTERAGAVILAAIVIWDLIVATDGRSGNTFSEIVAAHRHHAEFPWAWGVLAGHFFQPMKHRVHPAVTFPVLAACVAAARIFNPAIHPLAACAIGIVTGILIWPQRPPEEKA